jgi:hypothetical protein
LEQWATGRNIQRFNGTVVILLTSLLSGLKSQRAAHQQQSILELTVLGGQLLISADFAILASLYAFRPIAPKLLSGLTVPSGLC